MNPSQLRKLQTLPRGRGTWQLGASRSHAAIADGSSLVPLLVVQGDGKVRAGTVAQVADAEAWADVIYAAMTSPTPPCKPGLPGALRCRDAATVAAIAPWTGKLKLRVEDGGDFSVLEQLEERLAASMAEAGGVDFPDEDAALYAAAAAFARAELWRHVIGEPHFQLETQIRGWEKPIAVPLGQAGDTFGLAVYRDEGSMPTFDPSRADSVVVFLDDEADPGSVRRARRLGYELVEDHHPSFLRVQPGRDPTAFSSPQHARLMTQALRAVLAWYERFERDGALDGEVALSGNAVVCRLRNPEVFEEMGYGPAASAPLFGPEEALPGPAPAGASAPERARAWLELGGTLIQRAVDELPVLHVDAFDDRLEACGFDAYTCCGWQVEWAVADLELPPRGERFYARTAARVDDPRAHAWLEALATARGSAWRIIAVEPGEAVVVEDLFAPGEQIRVLDEVLAEYAQIGEITLCRLVQIEELAVFTGTSPDLLSEAAANVLIPWVRQRRRSLGGAGDGGHVPAEVLLPVWADVVELAVLDERG